MSGNIRPIIQSVTVGATIGAACYVIARSSTKQKRCLKRNTGRTLRALGSIIEEFSSMIRM